MKHNVKVGDRFFLNDLPDAALFVVEEIDGFQVRLSCNGKNQGWWDIDILRNKRRA